MSVCKIMTREELELIPDIERVIREQECEWMTGIKRETRNYMEKNGTFPKRIHIGPQMTAWRLSEVQEWIKTRPTK
ncbi:AlpA family phage regulatory protein [Salmonella enterica subsp. enterica serovar Tennessee]|nr:AlpA family phage regulatory protein [Salmonella enterica subsp. enterica serovar Tennessee]